MNAVYAQHLIDTQELFKFSFSVFIPTFKNYCVNATENV